MQNAFRAVCGVTATSALTAAIAALGADSQHAPALWGAASALAAAFVLSLLLWAILTIVQRKRRAVDVRVDLVTAPEFTSDSKHYVAVVRNLGHELARNCWVQREPDPRWWGDGARETAPLLWQGDNSHSRVERGAPQRLIDIQPGDETKKVVIAAASQGSHYLYLPAPSGYRELHSGDRFRLMVRAVGDNFSGPTQHYLVQMHRGVSPAWNGLVVKNWRWHMWRYLIATKLRYWRKSVRRSRR